MIRDMENVPSINPFLQFTYTSFSSTENSFAVNKNGELPSLCLSRVKFARNDSTRVFGEGRKKGEPVCTRT